MTSPTCKVLPSYIIPKTEYVLLKIYAKPGAKRSEIQGVHGDALKVSIHAPPVDGEANEALIAWLADFLRLAKRNLEILHGHTSREKTVAVRGVTPAQLVAKFGPLVGTKVDAS
jgi:uncharacterized protein (TIGR00251 family)